MISPPADAWFAPAKINLWLAILGRRDDGFHEIDTALQAIDLGDTILLEPGPREADLECRIEGEWSLGIPAGEANLAARAARLLADRTGHELRLRMTVAKRIPPGAGLGGGSSDAAAALVALARRFAIPDPAHTLRALAAEVGADVPFFLEGGTQRARGFGERLEPLEPPPERWGILVWPGVSVDTTWAYRAWDERGPRHASSTVREGRNDFEAIVFDRFPAVHRAARLLATGGAAVVSLSGSGSAVYSLYAGESLRDRDLERVRARVPSISPEARAWAFGLIDHGVRPRECVDPEGSRARTAV